MDDPREREADLPLGFLLASVGQRAQSAFAARMTGRGMSPRAYGVLWALAREPRSQQALGTSLGLPASRMVALVDDLEQRGLAVRATDPRDRRAHLVSLTEAGRQRFVELAEEGRVLESSLVAGLSETELETLRRLVGRVAANLGGEGAGRRIR